MKWLLITILLLLVTGLAAFTVMAIQSQQEPEGLGLGNGLLRTCPDSPNCVCSEAHTAADTGHAIAPLQGISWDELKARLIKAGGEIREDNGHYMHATFRSSLFRYVDDVELRLDDATGVIHVRSASRAGRSDFGVNHKRVDSLR